MTYWKALVATSAIGLAGGFGAPPASAQSVQQGVSAAQVSQRVDRIERELRAVQRKVFPGSQGVLVQPDVVPDDGVARPAAPVSSATADLTARVEAVEAQMTRLTSQVEQTEFHQRETDTAIARLRTELSGLNGRVSALDAPAADTDNAAVSPAAEPRTPARVTPAPRTASPAAPTPRVTSGNGRSAPGSGGSTSAQPPAVSAERRARVAALELPATGNAADDAYLFGYRLWQAHLYPEAQAQLQTVIERYPTNARASFAGNLLGRAFLDNDQPSRAVQILYDNYRTRPRGERAPDSVYYMGMALIRLDRKTDACRTFDEFTRVYGATASSTLKAQVAAGRGQAGCS